MIGQYHTLFQELDRECAGDYMNYIRMDRNLFHEVLHRVLPRVSKLDCQRKITTSSGCVLAPFFDMSRSQ